MNKVLLVGRLVRDPETQTTSSGIKYSRFTVAVSRQFGENQTDFIPVVTWRNQADFVDNYMRKGSLVSIEGRFTSSTYQNNDNQKITRYEVTADRVQALESKNKAQTKESTPVEIPSAVSTQEVKFAEENKPSKEEIKEVPWELDL